MTSPRLTATLVVLLALAACGGGQRAGQGQPVRLALPALDGGTIDVGQYRGRPVVLHVFTAWSLNAQLDVPRLSQLSRSRIDVRVIGVALDPDGAALVEPWQAENRVPYPIALATEPVRTGQSPLGKIVEVPTTIVLDRSGRIAARVERPLADGELERLVQSVR